MQNDKQNHKQTNKQNRAEKHNNSTQTVRAQKEAKRVVTDTDKKRGEELLQNFQKQYPESEFGTSPLIAFRQ